MAYPAFANITDPDGAENMGGTTQRWYFSLRKEITTLQDVLPLSDDTATTNSEYAVITADHVWAATKKAFLVYCTEDKGTGEFAAQGEIDGKSLKANFKLFVPGIDGETLGTLRRLKNHKCVVWPELTDGQLLQLGSPMFAASVNIDKIGLATNSSGIRGTEISVTWMGSGAIIYEGALTL